MDFCHLPCLHLHRSRRHSFYLTVAQMRISRAFVVAGAVATDVVVLDFNFFLFRLHFFALFHVVVLFTYIFACENVYSRFAVDAPNNRSDGGTETESKMKLNSTTQSEKSEKERNENNTKINKLYDFIYLSTPIRFCVSRCFLFFLSSSYLWCVARANELGRTVVGAAWLNLFLFLSLIHLSLRLCGDRRCEITHTHSGRIHPLYFQ